MFSTLAAVTTLVLAGDGKFDPKSGAVMGGADVVEYFNLPDRSKGVFGTAENKAEFGGYTFYFTSGSNVATFNSNPSKYLPTWGGFCAWGISREDPPQWPWAKDFMGPPCNPIDGWRIHNGTLYCALTAGIMDQFLEEPRNIELGNKRWVNWYQSLNAGPLNNQCYQTDTNSCVNGEHKFPNRTSNVSRLH
eukprot:TRINITY_DN16050_c0_g1_i1.p1 TRINITY_DN16050_c0_g1~~TRINITY_DN16050_c0_g1_i1.p1  ORF type:complete len:191 (+),score=27.96 TRINITY_DN16050_c0_g1_i1:49-621(+)